MEYVPVRVSDIIRKVNRDLFLPAIQREFVWGPDRIERLFDSIMSDFPIGSFLFWGLEQHNKDQWPVYEFIRDFNAQDPHNTPANMSGINKDITLVLDGQQRITSLYIGLKGEYRHFYYRWRTNRLYLNLLKPPVPNDENPEELTYGFAFRENDLPVGDDPQLWYSVGKILDFNDAEDAKSAMRAQMAGLTEEQRETANRLIGRLHNRIHTTLVGNYYKERSQDYDKVLQVFVRANSAGQALEYSDLLLATATAKWETLDARREIHEFTDAINEIGNGYKFGKDFVLKACLYLSETEKDGQFVGLPIQYKVKNFTKKNLLVIEENWESIKRALETTIRLISRFGFHAKNVVAPLALLPIAYYLKKRGNSKFDQSSNAKDAEAQIAIRKWFVMATLKNAFGGSSDTTLTRLRELLKTSNSTSEFPAEALYRALGIEPRLSSAEIERILAYGYQGRYTNLVLSLLYPDRDWKDAVFHEDHIFPQSQFGVSLLKKRGYDGTKVKSYMDKFNTLANLELLTDSENVSKNATPFDEWIKTRDATFRKRHLIPEMESYGFDSFEKFFEERTRLIVQALSALNGHMIGTEIVPVAVREVAAIEAESDADSDGDADASRAPSGRDYTKFKVTIDGNTSKALSKRATVLMVVKHLCSRGVTPDEIATCVPWRSMFCKVEGTLDSAAFVATGKVDSGGIRRFFCEDDELIHCDGATYAVANGWGKRTAQALRNILERFGDKGVSCEEC